MRELPWSAFKSFVQSRALSIQYVDVNDHYYMWACDGPMVFECSLYKDASSDITDFENNFKAAGNKSFTDGEGQLLVRGKAAKAGATFSIVPIELTTAEIDACVSELYDESPRTGVTQKIYDAEDNEITTEEDEVNAVKTVVDFEPPYDYEIIGGHIQQKVKPTTPIRVWVVAVPDVSAAYGGSKEMVGGVNLEYIDPTDKIEADGRVSKYMRYNTTYHTNKLRFIIRHDAGVQHEIMIMLEMFK